MRGCRYPRRMVEALAESRASLARRLRTLTLNNLHAAHEHMMLLGRKNAGLHPSCWKWTAAPPRLAGPCWSCR
jgi:hypothetical protein